MILFFIRRFNDIDHTVPIVYRLAKDGFKDMAVLALNPDFDLSEDFRINFLKDKCAVTVEHVHKFFMPSLIHRFLGRFICNSGGQHFSITGKLNKVFRAVLKDRYTSLFLNSLIFKRFFGDRWAERMFLAKGTRLVVFDWQKFGKLGTLSLSRAAKKLSIPILAVPHGISLYTNKDWIASTSSGDTLLNFGGRWKDFDKIIVQFEHYKRTVVSAGVPLEKLLVLGSTRFCREWEKVYEKLIPCTDIYSNKGSQGKVKIVFMDHAARYRTTVDKVIDTVEKLVRLEYVDLVIKPSTSSRSALTSMMLYDIAKVDFNTSSVELIKWADVVMGTTSSILIEPLLMGKIFIYPKYFHDNNMLWDEMRACWKVANYNELEEALSKVAKNTGHKPYSDADVNSFITEVVYGGVSDRDVLGDYKDYILSLVCDMGH